MPVTRTRTFKLAAQAGIMILIATSTTWRVKKTLGIIMIMIIMIGGREQKTLAAKL
jgi:hypothetical protein